MHRNKLQVRLPVAKFVWERMATTDRVSVLTDKKLKKQFTHVLCLIDLFVMCTKNVYQFSIWAFHVTQIPVCYDGACGIIGIFYRHLIVNGKVSFSSLLGISICATSTQNRKPSKQCNNSLQNFQTDMFCTCFHLGCYYRYRNLFHRVLEVGESMSKVLTDLISGKGLFLLWSQYSKLI